MEFVTNRLGYWMRRIKAKFPEVYALIPIPTRALFVVQRMTKGKYVIYSNSAEQSPKEQQEIVISYTYEPSWGYIGLEFHTTKGVHKSMAFDMEKLYTP